MHYMRRETRQPDELKVGDRIQVVATIEEIRHEGDDVVVRFSGTERYGTSDGSIGPIWVYKS
jgi:hypothetical protein